MDTEFKKNISNDKWKQCKKDEPGVYARTDELIEAHRLEILPNLEDLLQKYKVILDEV